LSAAFTIPFEDCEAGSIRLVGGKCASLGELLRAGLDVPPGFAVTTEAHRLFLEGGDLRAREEELLGGIDHERVAELTKASGELRALVEQAPIPDEVVAGVRSAYAALAERSGRERLPVAVRSSATAEDMAAASFAGQLQTYLWISGEDAVVDYMRRCWSGFFTPEAISYRRRMEIPPEEALMSVAIQQMVDARTAGVMFTLNPVNGDRSKIMIESAWGLGEAVVSGEVDPDRFLVDKVILAVLERTIASKQLEYRLDAERGEVVSGPVDEDRRDEASLSDPEVLALARLGKQIEKHYGRPMDVEWAVDATRGELFLLQARAETVWSRKERPALVDKKGSALDYVLADLLGRGHKTGGKA
jgi:phenol phosphorylase subunit beta